MRAALYLRISEDRSGDQLGVARQREDCLTLCAEKGWQPVEYVDNDTSATSGKRRPAYERMLEDIRDGTIGAVVVWDLDRLHRRPIELEAFMALADDKHLALASVSGDIDLGSPQGRLVARLKGSVAAHEGEHRKARQLRATRQLAERGVPNWHHAFGYDDHRQPDPVTAPLVKQAYSAVVAAASLGDVCRIFNEAGAHTRSGKPWDAATASSFLRKPRNAGLRTYNHRYGPVTRDDIIGPGDWPSLVDEDLFWAAQGVLEAPGRAPGRKSVRKHLLTGVMRCGRCGGTLAGVPDERGNLRYRCRGCLSLSIRASQVEPLVHQLVAGRLAMPDAVDLLKADHDTDDAETLRTQANTLRTELDAIGVERADGLLTGRQAKIATDRINDKLAVIEARQHDAERVRVFDQIPLGTPEVADAIATLSPDRFRAVLDVLADITINPVGKNGGRVFNPERCQVVWR